MELLKKDGPFIEHKQSTGKIMRNLLIALIPIILFSFYKNGYVPYEKGYLTSYGLFYPLIMVLIPAVTSFLIEFFYQIIFMKRRRGKEILYDIKHNYSFIPGLFLGLILPYNTSIEMLIVGAIAATLVGKLLFGGFGNNVFNPALVGMLVVTILYGSAISDLGGYKNPHELDTISAATPLSALAVEGQYSNYETLVTPYGGFDNMFIGLNPGAPGETSILLCTIAFIFLALTKTIKWRISATYIFTAYILATFMGLLNGVGLWYGLYHLLSGGLLFGAVFMATDPITSPTTKLGQVLYGLSLGVATILFRFISTYPDGVMLSILTLNMTVFIFDKVALKSKLNKKPLMILCVIILAFSSLLFFYKEKEKETNIISADVNGTKIEYIATTTGRDGEIKVKIIINDGVVEVIEILENKESYYNMIKNADYTTVLINGQNKISEVDTVSGATITSKALKELIESIIEDYNSRNLGVKVGDKEVGPIEVKKISEVLSKTEENGNTIYIVNTPSLRGITQLKVIISSTGTILSIEYINKNDLTIYNEYDLEYLEIVEHADYLTTIIQNQANLDNVDTVSGATVSSGNIKNAIKETLENWNE
jgi:Predicted NADH:ubiquinone oxidoreductase, subunit RnfD